MAQETVKILEAGFYDHPEAGRVSIAEDLQRAIAGTALVRPEEAGAVQEKRATMLAPRGDAPVPSISVVNESTLAAARRILREGASDCLVLNFASAKNPGGGFLGGAEAQEESIARSSGLYPCLLAQPEYYEANRRFGSCLYTDHIIYSPAVPVIRDDRGDLLDSPYLVSIITAPAPNAGAIKDRERGDLIPTLKRRVELVLSIAVIHGHRHLVLGAWGCGVFRNDPKTVAEVFRDYFLDRAFRGAFDRVVFAILDWSSEKRFIRPFEQIFGQSS